MTDLTALLAALPPELRERLGAALEIYESTRFAWDTQEDDNIPSHNDVFADADRALSACLNLLGERERMLRLALGRWDDADHFLKTEEMWLADLRARAEAERGT
jgi:hypothetical protein